MKITSIEPTLKKKKKKGNNKDMPDIEKEPLLLPDFKKYLSKYLKKRFTVQQFRDKISTKPQQEKFEYFYILQKE